MGRKVNGSDCPGANTATVTARVANHCRATSARRSGVSEGWCATSTSGVTSRIAAACATVPVRAAVSGDSPSTSHTDAAIPTPVTRLPSRTATRKRTTSPTRRRCRVAPGERVIHPQTTTTSRAFRTPKAAASATGRPPTMLAAPLARATAVSSGSRSRGRARRTHATANPAEGHQTAVVLPDGRSRTAARPSAKTAAESAATVRTVRRCRRGSGACMVMPSARRGATFTPSPLDRQPDRRVRRQPSARVEWSAREQGPRAVRHGKR